MLTSSGPLLSQMSHKKSLTVAASGHEAPLNICWVYLEMSEDENNFGDLTCWVSSPFSHVTQLISKTLQEVSFTLIVLCVCGGGGGGDPLAGRQMFYSVGKR